jgi:tRNA(Ser,Leu) C12 N-acetylase TAN1
MKVLKGVLKEELANSLQMLRSYNRELAGLPKGSLVKKKIKGHQYYYLVTRTHGRVKFLYKGKILQQEVEKYKRIKEFRAKYRKNLSELKQQIRFLRRALRGKESV